MDTIALQNQILELQKQLEIANKEKAKKEKRKEYMRGYMKKYYHDNHEKEVERLRIRANKYYHENKLPETKLLKMYEYLEELKNTNPEHLEEIKLILAN
jgi:hypothetical protein